MFFAALFTISRTWKQCKCPSTDEWIQKMWCICAMEYYSATKKNKIMPFAVTWMDMKTVTWHLIAAAPPFEQGSKLKTYCLGNLKNELVYKAEIDPQT